jgi:hypothetical protein
MCELVTELTKDVQNGNKTGASMTQDIEDEKLVQIVGRLLGYGRVMQICEEEWTRRDSIGALTVGPCVFYSPAHTSVIKALQIVNGAVDLDV